MKKVHAIEVENLVKQYGAKRAVDDVSLQVSHGEIFGILGPNGAGKTTTMECMEGLVEPTSGQVLINGKPPAEVVPGTIGVQLQEARMFSQIKVRELLRLYASLYSRTADIDAVVDKLLLREKLDSYFGNLSGGQKQRVFVTLALLPDPEILFLDEITSGLDPQARLSIWRFLRELKAGGKTIVMTTHYLEEAQQLCDRIALLKDGRLIAYDDTRTLVQRLDSWKHIKVVTDKVFSLDAVAEMPGVRIIEHDGREALIGFRSRRFIQRLVNELAAQGADILDIATREPSLEDIFMQLVGEPADPDKPRLEQVS